MKTRKLFESCQATFDRCGDCLISIIHRDHLSIIRNVENDSFNFLYCWCCECEIWRNNSESRLRGSTRAVCVDQAVSNWHFCDLSPQWPNIVCKGFLKETFLSAYVRIASILIYQQILRWIDSSTDPPIIDRSSECISYSYIWFLSLNDLRLIWSWASIMFINIREELKALLMQILISTNTVDQSAKKLEHSLDSVNGNA